MDWKAALIAIGSALALLRFKRTVIEVIAAAGLVGLLLAHV
jgi:chromate transporter